jgi:outer membrane protein
MSKKITLLFSAFLICTVALVIYQIKSQPKTGYVLIQDLYNGFEMKKEMEKKYKITKDARDKILDSLSFELKMIANQIQSEEEKNKETIKKFEIKREEYFQKKQAFEEDNEMLTKKYDQEILTQLNQYVKDYSSAQGYTYVFGNDGNGSLMYGNEDNNITKEVVEYINNKYKGL